MNQEDFLPQRVPALMWKISLLVPVTGTDLLDVAKIEAYRSVLAESGRFAAIEIVLAGQVTDAARSKMPADLLYVASERAGKVAAVRAGIEVASGDIVVVVNPQRNYPPEAIEETLAGLMNCDADLVIGVPRRQPSRPWPSAVLFRGLGFISKMTLGTSDVFSGLVAMWRARVTEIARRQYGSGSWLVLDLLSWPGTVHCDLAVNTSASDGLRPPAVRLEDFKQLKRLLDHRFGTISRLVQFCIVGASGMVVDLSLYAFLQWLFARFWVSPSGSASVGFSWQLATAGALSIFTAMVWNFTLNRRLTFNDSRGGSILRQFVTYALGNALAIVVNLSLRLFLPHSVQFFAHHRLAAAVVGIVVATGISFSMSRWIVFIRRPAPATPVSSPVALSQGTVLHESAVIS